MLPRDYRYYASHIKTDEEVCAKTQQAIGLHEDFLTIVKRRRLKWCGHTFRSSSVTKTILQVTVKGGRRQECQKSHCSREVSTTRRLCGLCKLRSKSFSSLSFATRSASRTGRTFVRKTRKTKVAEMDGKDGGMVGRGGRQYFHPYTSTAPTAIEELLSPLRQ